MGNVRDWGQQIISGEEAPSLAPQLCCHLPGGLASPHGVSVPNRSLGRQSQATVSLLYQSKVAFLAQVAGRMCSVHIYLVIEQLSSDCGKGCGFVQDSSDQLSALLLKSP